MFLDSRTTNTGDANGSREGVCDGTDTLGIEAEVSYATSFKHTV